MNKKKSIKVLVSGYIGFNNFGDEAIFTVLCDNLKQNNCKITVITASPETTAKTYNVKTCKTFDIIKIITEIISCDVLISGGGSLLQDKTSIKSLFYYLFIILCAKFFGKKIIIFAQGIGPLNKKISLIATQFTLKLCNLINVRDEKSFQFLKNWGLSPILQTDPVFNYNLPAYDPQKNIGIQLRAWKDLNEGFLDKLTEVICQNFADYKILIFSFQDNLDLNTCKILQEKINKKNQNIKTEIITNSTTPIELLNRFKTIEYLIAMRFHACLIALKFGIKTLAINYDAKVEKLANEAKIPFINLNKKDELQPKIQEMKQLKSQDLLNYANNKNYNFDIINNLICNLK